MNTIEIANSLKRNPLVSIIVITYNSSNYVLETLESAKAQTYQNIELIISDDCSTDNTVTVCEEWLQKNKDRFVRTQLITVKENTGIPKNCNRGLYAAKGEWVKLIAGDDALMANCIKDNIEFVKSDSRIKFCFSDYEAYKDTFEDSNLVNYKNDSDARSKQFSELNNEFQLKVMIRNIVLHGPATFYKRNKFLEMGGYDESYSFVEDRLTFFNWLKAGNKFYYLPKKTIKYRINDNSITNKNLVNNSYINDFFIKFRDLIYEKFYSYFTFKEKVYFHVRYKYYLFFKKDDNLNFFIKVFRRLWYFLVQKGEKENYNALNKFYKEYKNRKF
ncbi:glycosyltransferase [Lutibacter sp. A64]|uniref:glycosyltransferase family 2 protein n=1 Tax=Lutibacter sp. A64 TaxID=2918526 RepID=UPI001F0666EE|nr:glycosyltransferase [Lutibacter sp. A64]UMB55470.1 glycosyltransferase [Lutibacter sp. A64]